MHDIEGIKTSVEEVTAEVVKSKRTRIQSCKWSVRTWWGHAENRYLGIDL